MNCLRQTTTLAAAVAVGVFCIPSAQGSPKETQERLGEATTVLTEIMNAPDKGIPDDMLKRAQCVVVVPSLKKGAFLVSGEFGKGFLTCRKRTSWSAPAAMRVEGGGVGLQIGS